MRRREFISLLGGGSGCMAARCAGALAVILEGGFRKRSARLTRLGMELAEGRGDGILIPLIADGTARGELGRPLRDRGRILECRFLC
jgi:hypothetical protein